jgi:putative ABC transport system permease protein
MSDFWQDLRYGVRMLLRAPAFTVIVIAILALGVGANSAIFSVINAVLLRPLPYRDPGRLYRIAETNPRNEPQEVSPADMLVFRQRSRAFESFAVTHWLNETLTGAEGPENVYGGKVSAECFDLLGSAPAIGRVFRREEFQPGAPGVVLLSDRLWKRRYGRNPSVIGRSLMLSGNPHVIVGVMAPDFYLDRLFEFWTPWQFNADDTSRRTLRTTVVARLRAGATLRQGQAELLAIFREIAPDDAKKGWGIRVTPLATWATERFRPALLVSLGAVGLVLLIACCNIANLLLVRASDRSREIALRAALGAGRLRMVRQLLTESVLLAFLGGGAGLLAGAWGAKGLVALFPERIPIPRLDQTRLDSAVLLFTLALTVVTGLAFGLLPALRAAGINLHESLKQGSRGSTGGARGRRVRNLLVIAETALSLILLTGAGLMLRSFDRLMRVDAGFDPDRVLTMRIPLPSAITEKAQRPAYYTRILDRLKGLPGLNSAGLIAPLPLTGVDANGTFAVEGHPPAPGETQLVKLRIASPGYFRAMGLTLRRGRVFDESDTADASPVAVVSESLARKYFPGEDAVGKRITMSSEGKPPFMTIIGVVKDVRHMNLGANVDPEMYRDYRQFFFAPFAVTVALRMQSGDPMRIAGLAQREIRALSPDQPISDLKTMTRVVADNVSQPRFYTLLLTIFAAIAMLLAATGLYGVLSYSVTQRAREIGVRIALGASRQAIFGLVLREAMVMVGVGIVLGLGGSVALTRLMAAQLFQTTPTDPATFAVVSLLMLAVAAAAVYVPARRAVQVEPIIALHE